MYGILNSTCEATLIHKHNECVISDVFAIEYTQGEVQLWLRSLNLNIEVKGRKRSLFRDNCPAYENVYEHYGFSVLSIAQHSTLVLKYLLELLD